ncbi:MAG: hypothetical protein D6741_03525 [Planctomycetota bacterium]|nr:MAG: hypothetical protein D6741_03525 [Planctomycetota bacterium]
MHAPPEIPTLSLNRHLVNLLAMVLGLAAGYFMTIQSLKLELADKAETAVVEALDKKMANLEVMLKEGVVSREQFYKFSKDTEARLTRIEQYLINQTGENLGKR